MAKLLHNGVMKIGGLLTPEQREQLIRAVTLEGSEFPNEPRGAKTVREYEQHCLDHFADILAGNTEQNCGRLAINGDNFRLTLALPFLNRAHCHLRFTSSIHPDAIRKLPPFRVVPTLPSAPMTMDGKSQSLSERLQYVTEHLTDLSVEQLERLSEDATNAVKVVKARKENIQAILDMMQTSGITVSDLAKIKSDKTKAA